MTLSAFSPEHESTNIAVVTVLSWQDSVVRDHYEVYFGTDADHVAAGTGGTYRGNVTEKRYDPRVSLSYDTLYYWRIVAVKAGVADVDSGVKSFSTIGAATLPVAKNYAKRLCAAANDGFWYENNETPPRMVQLAGLVLDTDSPLSMEEYQQKVYIANGTILKVVDFMNTKIAVSGMTNCPERGSTVSQATTGAQMIVDYVAPSNAAIYGRTISEDPFEEGYQLSGGGMTAVNAGTVTEPTVPHHYDWTTYAGNDTFYGALPARATILKRYRNRLVLSGNPADPHQWYLLRQDDPYDALYAGDDAQSPVAGQQSEAGKIGDIVTACIPYGDDYCIWGSVGALWVMRGDPAAGGSLDNLDNTVGCISKDAWCKDDRKNLYVLDTTGLYRIPYPMGPPQALVDEDVIPTFVNELNLNPEKQRITLAFDQTRKGILICVTDIQLGTNANYWYDSVTRGFFPEEYPDEDSVYAMHFYNADEPAYRQLLLGCRDGHIRIFDDAAKDDDTGSLAEPASEAIDSWVLLGPVRISKGVNLFGLLNSLTFVTAGGGAGGSIPDSDDIEYTVIVDKTAEGVIEKCDEIDVLYPQAPAVLPDKVKVAYLGKEEVFVRSTETGDYVSPDASFYVAGGLVFGSSDYIWTLTEPTATPRSWILQGQTATNPFGVYSPVDGSGATGNAIVGVIPKFSGQVKAPGRSFQKRLRAKGVFAGIRIGNSAKGQTWGIERVTGQAVDGGPVR